MNRKKERTLMNSAKVTKKERKKERKKEKKNQNKLQINRVRWKKSKVTQKKHTNRSASDFKIKNCTQQIKYSFNFPR